MKPLSKWLLRVAFFLLGLGPFFALKANEPAIPPHAKEYLRHDKHGLLVFGSRQQGTNWLVTRQRTYEQKVVWDHEKQRQLDRLGRYFLGGPDIPKGQLIPQLQSAYGYLLSPFETILEDLNQLTIVPSLTLRHFPFEALVPPDFGDGAPLFIGESYSINYLMDFSFQPEPPKDLVPQLRFDSAGTFWDALPPQNHAHYILRSPTSPFFPIGVRDRCLTLIEEGASAPDALAEARNEFFAAVRNDPQGIDSSLLDPRHWAQAMVYGSVEPIHPSRDFPWWILVPIGLVLVIVFGKKL